jgi:hypothetical protein
VSLLLAEIVLCSNEVAVSCDELACGVVPDVLALIVADSVVLEISEPMTDAVAAPDSFAESLVFAISLDCLIDAIDVITALSSVVLDCSAPSCASAVAPIVSLPSVDEEVDSPVVVAVDVAIDAPSNEVVIASLNTSDADVVVRDAVTVMVTASTLVLDVALDVVTSDSSKISLVSFDVRVVT